MTEAEGLAGDQPDEGKELTTPSEGRPLRTVRPDGVDAGPCA
ncbi:hypothetical protein ACFTZK_02640 [Streptomyces decoyicus]